MKNVFENLKNRDLYLNRLLAFQDKEPIKVVTGIRRSGKSSLLKLMVQHLLASGVGADQIIEMNFESYDYKGMTSDELYSFVKSHSVTGRMYLFFDEVQRVDRWEEAINAFRVDLDCDIYVTGSNAYLLSSELSTYLAGRYVEIKVLPLSFREFLDFNGYTVQEYTTPFGAKKNRILGEGGNTYEADDLLQTYMLFGGMPGIAGVGLEQEKVFAVLDGIYSTIVVRDILEREKRRGERQITDAELLRKIILFLSDNIGSNVSLTSISNTLVSENLLANRARSGKPAVQTIQAYVASLLDSFVFYEIKRFDIKGKELLKTLGKYYIADLGIRNYLLGNRGMDTGHALENIVYFELLRRGFDVAVGKIGTREIDFVATNANKKMYIQVTERMEEETTRERELAPLRAVKDNHEKLVLLRHGNTCETEDGIKIRNIFDFLLTTNS